MKRLPLDPFGSQLHFKSTEDFLATSPDEFRQIVEEDKLVLVRGLGEINRGQFLEFAEEFHGGPGDISEKLLFWSFGPVMEMKVEAKTENYLFSTERVPFHWDGAFHVEPRYLLFNCIQAPEQGAGGETFFCDTERVCSEVVPHVFDSFSKFRLSYETQKLAHYGGRVERSLVETHPQKGCPVLRYAEPVETALNPVKVRVEGLSDSEQATFHKKLSRLIYSEKFCYEHQWQTGDFLVVDNFSTIHGRNAFTKQTPRHLRRIQVL